MTGTVTYTWRATVVVFDGPVTRQSAYAGRAWGPIGYAAEDARSDAQAWLRQHGVRGLIYVRVTPVKN